MQARWKRARSPPARRRVYRTSTRQRAPNLPEFSPEGKANPPTTNMIGSDHAWNGVHIPFPSLGHLTELLSEPTVERVSKVTPATDQIEGDQHGTEAKEGQQSGLVSKGSKRNKSALADLTYPPLNVLKPVCRDIWIVDGPLIGFGALGIRLPFPTRMTIVRLEGGLFIHSPTVLSPTLRAAIDDLEIGRAPV